MDRIGFYFLVIAAAILYLLLIRYRWSAIWRMLSKWYPANRIFANEETARIMHALLCWFGIVYATYSIIVEIANF